MDTTVGNKKKFPLCTDSPLTCEWSGQQKSPKSCPKVASDLGVYFKRNQKSRRLIFIWGKNCLRAYSVQTQVASMRKRNKKKLQFCLLARVTSLFISIQLSLAVVCFVYFVVCFRLYPSASVLLPFPRILWISRLAL